MNEQNDYTEMEYPYYPTGSRHQKAIVIKVNAMVPILPGEEFKTAGKRDEINKLLHATLVEKINTCIKAFEDAGLIDKATVGEDDKNTHKSTENDSNDTSHTSTTKSLLASSSRPAGDTKKINVFYHDDTPICPFCFEDGFTIKKRDGEIKNIPPGGHNTITEKDIMYSAKYGKPVGMCYHHSELYYKLEDKRTRMNTQLVELGEEIPNNPNSGYTLKEIDIKVEV